MAEITKAEALLREGKRVEACEELLFKCFLLRNKYLAQGRIEAVEAVDKIANELRKLRKEVEEQDKLRDLIADELIGSTNWDELNKMLEEE